MKSTHHSEYLKLRSVFLKRAKDAFISYEIISKEWKELNYLSPPDFMEANKEYAAFEVCLKNESIELHYFPLNDTVSMDSIYCRDAAIATDFGMILCNMGKSGRRNEPQIQKEIYRDQNIPILGEITDPGTLEGGDVAWLDEKTLAVGHSYRTNEEGISQLKRFLEPKGIEIIVVDLPHYRGKEDVFHLMSILSPVDADLVVVYSPLLPVRFRNELIKRGFDLVDVPHEEFDSMGCNVLALAPRKCLMVDGNPKTRKALLAAGCEVLVYTGDHISLMGGGGPTCLTRPLDRAYLSGIFK